MRVLLIAIAVLGMAQAEAASLCASPSEVKLLKAAMLEQALTAAAQSCHQSAQFSRFVAAYHGGMVQSDRALKAFFARRNVGESYDAYKARMAAEIASRSLHDASFCPAAGRIFDIALKHKHVVAPTLLATGYEHCGLPRAKPVIAEAALRPVKPVVAPPPVLTPAAREALALAHRSETPPLPQPKPPLRVAQALLAAAPIHVAPLRAPAPIKAAPLQTELVSAVPARAEVEEAPYREDDRVPNAYKPGAHWVEQEAPPTRESRPLVQGADGRWYVEIGHHDHWTHD